NARAKSSCWQSEQRLRSTLKPGWRATSANAISIVSVARWRRFLRQAGHSAAGELSRTHAATFSVAGFTRVVLPPHYEGAGGDTPYVLLHVTRPPHGYHDHDQDRGRRRPRRPAASRTTTPTARTDHALAAKPCGAKRNAFANL